MLVERMGEERGTPVSLLLSSAAPGQREVQQAMNDHVQSQKSFRDNRRRHERLTREAAVGTMLDPELPDLTLIERVRLSTRIRNALNKIGDIREASDATLLSLPDLGSGSVREKLGLPSTECDRPLNSVRPRWRYRLR